MASSTHLLPPPVLPPWLLGLLPASTFRRYRVPLGDGLPPGLAGLTLHVTESGPADAPPVLLLHGNPTWGFLWRRVAAALYDAPLRLLMPDLFGLGFSDKPSNPAVHTVENHAAAIGRLLEILQLAPLVFVGQDWGGPIGLRALSDRPALMRGLVLMNTAAGPPRPGFRPTTFHRFARLPLISDLAFRALGFPQVALWSGQGDRTSISGDVARAYRYPLRHLSDRVAPLALARMVPDSLEHPSIPALRRCEEFTRDFKGPAAIVWGDRDPVLGRALSRVTALLPQAEVTRTPAGHFLQEEVPGPIAAAIRRVAGV